MKKPTISEKTLKQIQDAFGKLSAEFGGDERAELARLLQPVFPQPELMPGGGHYYTPDEVQFFDALFERFGLQFRSSDDRFDDIAYMTELWYRLVSGLGGHIECSWYSPKLFALELKSMPPDWQAYLMAVIADDRGTTQRLAKLLDIENLDAFCIKAMFG